MVFKSFSVSWSYKTLSFKSGIFTFWPILLVDLPLTTMLATSSSSAFIFKENLITDEKELYSLAKAKGYKVSHSSVDNEFTCIATLIEKNLTFI